MEGLEYFNLQSRRGLFERLTRESFDLLVLGGGITGASVFRDAAMRGMKVALVEARDFASGASSRSSRLIHGGLRYLKALQLGLVWEACHERDLHLRLNPRLVRPLPFLIPIYRSQHPSRALLRPGMWFYEALAGFGNQRFHRFLGRDETLALAPGLSPSGLEGGCLYCDAAVDDSRWTIETIKDGVRNEGLALNYAAAIRLRKEGGRVCGVLCRDQLSDAICEVRARVVVNAAGGAVDQVRRLDQPGALPLVRLSKGTHLVFAQEDLPLRVSTVFSSPLDHKPLFLARREHCFLLGASDAWEEADPGLPAPGVRDVGYLLESARRFLPGAGLCREMIRRVYSGFRPLVASRAPASPAASREDTIEVSPSGLVSVVGGKLTTARQMAKRVLRRVCIQLGGPWPPCTTRLVPLAGSAQAIEQDLAAWSHRAPGFRACFQALYAQYGLDARELGEETVQTADPLAAELRYVCRRELACTLEDLVERRLGKLWWSNEQRLDYLRRVEPFLSAELGLSSATFAAQYRSYEEYLRRLHTLPDLPAPIVPSAHPEAAGSPPG